MSYRGGSKLWSNRYHFNGGVPGTTPAWTTLADAVVAAEKTCLAAAERPVTITEAAGYVAGSEVAVFSKVYSVVGTLTSGGSQCPGECAALVRFNTAARSTKNHPIYAFNYYHGVENYGDTTPDELAHNAKTALETYATAWITGFSDGTHTLVRATPQGAGATSRVVAVYITHRDFPR